jgi:hypothetical protein
MFRYRLHSPDGEDLGEASYAVMIHAGEEIHGSGGQRLRVVAVVPFEEEDESPFVGLHRSREIGSRGRSRGSPPATDPPAQLRRHPPRAVTKPLKKKGFF